MQFGRYILNTKTKIYFPRKGVIKKIALYIEN